MGGFLFENEVYCLKCNNFNTAVAGGDRMPASGSFIDMQSFNHGVFVIGVGTEDTAESFRDVYDFREAFVEPFRPLSGSLNEEASLQVETHP